MEEQKDISNTEFVITRHAHSCNNLKSSKSSFSAMERAYEFDPGLSIYGVLTTLIKTSKIKSLESENKRYDSDVVFVSPLVRTWLTSLLLYLPNIEESETLNLVVSPHLIEKRYELEGTQVGGADETWLDSTKKYVGKNINPVNYLTSTKNKDKNIRKSKEFWLGEENIAPPQSITQQTLDGILKGYLFRLNRKDIQEKMTMLLDYIKKQIIEIPHTIDGGNLPSDVGQQIIMLFNFFDTLGALYETVSKEINKDIATKKMDTKFDIYFHELYKYFSIELLMPSEEVNLQKLQLQKSQAASYEVFGIEGKNLKKDLIDIDTYLDDLRKVKDKYIKDVSFGVKDIYIIKNGKTITGPLKYLHAILYDFTGDILNKIKDYFTAEENKYFPLDAKVKYALKRINKYEKDFKKWEEEGKDPNRTKGMRSLNHYDDVEKIRDKILGIKTNLEKYNKKLAIAKALDNKDLKTKYDGSKDNPLNERHPMVKEMIYLWNDIKSSALDKNSSIYEESEKNFQKFQENGNYFGDIKDAKNNRTRKVFVETIIQLERRKEIGLPYEEIFIKSKEGSNKMSRNFTDVTKARKRKEELEEKQNARYFWWDKSYDAEIKEQEELYSQRYDDVRPGDRVHIKVPDSKKPIPGIVKVVDDDEIEVEFEKVYTDAFDYIDYLNHTSNDDPYKLIYQALEKMKNKTFKIIIPQTVDNVVSREPVTKPYESNDFTLTVSVNEKFHITFPRRQKSGMGNELRVGDELTNNQYLYKYYYFVTPKDFPGFRNHPMATVKDVVENYEKLRGINIENVKNYTDYEMDKNGRVRKKERKGSFEEMKMEVGKGIMMQTQYEEKMRVSFKFYIPEVIKSIDTTNICEQKKSSAISLENCTDLTRICTLDESDGKCKWRKGLDDEDIEREEKQGKIEDRNPKQKPPEEGEKGTLVDVASEVQNSQEIQNELKAAEVKSPVVPSVEGNLEVITEPEEVEIGLYTQPDVPDGTEVGPNKIKVGQDGTEEKTGLFSKGYRWVENKLRERENKLREKEEKLREIKKEEEKLLKELQIIKNEVDSKLEDGVLPDDAIKYVNIMMTNIELEAFKEKMKKNNITPSEDFKGIEKYLNEKINAVAAPATTTAPAPAEVDGTNVDGVDTTAYAAEEADNKKFIPPPPTVAPVAPVATESDAAARKEVENKEINNANLPSTNDLGGVESEDVPDDGPDDGHNVTSSSIFDNPKKMENLAKEAEQHRKSREREEKKNNGHDEDDNFATFNRMFATNEKKKYQDLLERESDLNINDMEERTLDSINKEIEIEEKEITKMEEEEEVLTREIEKIMPKIEESNQINYTTIELNNKKDNKIVLSNLTKEEVERKYGKEVADKWEERENKKKKLKERKESMEKYKKELEEKQQFQVQANKLLANEGFGVNVPGVTVGGNLTHPFLDYGNLDRFFSIWIQNSDNQEHIKNLISRNYKNTCLSERELTDKEKETLKQIMEKNTKLKRINKLGFLSRKFKKEFVKYFKTGHSGPDHEEMSVAREEIHHLDKNFKLRISNKIHVVNHGSNMNEYLNENKEKLTELPEKATPIGLKNYLKVFAHNLYEILEAAAGAHVIQNERAGNVQEPKLKEFITLKLKDAFDMIGQVPKDLNEEQEVTIKILNSSGKLDDLKHRGRVKKYLESIQLQPVDSALQQAFTKERKGVMYNDFKQRGLSSYKVDNLMREFDYACERHDEYLKRFNAPYNEIKMLLPKNKKEIIIKEEVKKIEDNIWDMDFILSGFVGDVNVEQLILYSGSPKPNPTVLHSSCERLCSYGHGLGIFVDNERIQTCNNKTSNNKTRKKTFMSSIFSGKQLRTVVPNNDSTTSSSQGGQKKKRTKRKKYKMQKTQRKKSKKNKTKRKMK